MTLQQLEYFCLAARYHSFTKAAKELCLTQPTVSIAIHELEQEFGVLLFTRTNNVLTLTSEGEEFYHKASRMLDYGREIYADFGEANRKHSAIRVGIPPMLSMVYFPELLDSFQKEYPNIPATLLEYGSARACELVQNDILDVAIVNMGYYQIDKLCSRCLAKEQMLFCTSKKFPLLDSDRVELQDIADIPLILFNTDSVQNQILKLRFESLQLYPNILMQCSQINLIRTFLNTRPCGIILFESMLPLLPELNGIPLSPEVETEVGIVWKKGKYLNSDIEKFLKFVCKYFQNRS